MLSPDVDVTDLDARHVKNWWHLLVPPQVLSPPRWALAILDGTTVVQVIISREGVLASPPAWTSPETYARTLNVDALVALDRSLIANLSSEIESQLRLDQDYVAQCLVALRALKKRAGHGLWTFPALLELLPAPADGPIQKTFDLLIPDRTSLAAYVIEDDRARVHASIIAVKERGSIVRASTHRALADLLPERALAADWGKQTKRLAAALEERFAPPSVLLVLERATLLRVLTGPSDQLARELNAKHVVVDPAPTWLLGLLGGAAVAAMAGRAASALASMLPQAARDRASALAHRAKEAVNPFGMLGFDPLELWSRLRHFYR